MLLLPALLWAVVRAALDLALSEPLDGSLTGPNVPLSLRITLDGGADELQQLRARAGSGDCASCNSQQGRFRCCKV